MDILKAIKRVYKERKTVLDQMKSRKVLVEITEFILIILMFCLSVLIFFWNFQVPILTYGLPLAIIVIILMFIFSGFFFTLFFLHFFFTLFKKKIGTLQELVNGLYMIYFLRPFNIGDQIQIGFYFFSFFSFFFFFFFDFLIEIKRKRRKIDRERNRIINLLFSFVARFFIKKKIDK